MQYSERKLASSRLLQELDGDLVKEIIKTDMLQWLVESRKVAVKEFRQILQIDTLAGCATYVVG